MNPLTSGGFGSAVPDPSSCRAGRWFVCLSLPGCHGNKKVHQRAEGKTGVL